MKAKFILLGAVVFAMFSCDNFLDKETSSRQQLSWTPDQISNLLVSAYATGNYGTICELSSDNFVDNNSPNPTSGVYYNLASRDRWNDEAFAWEDIVSAGDNQDSPSYVWNGFYYAIAVANNALEFIKTYEESGRGSEVEEQKGEALLARAYNHFLLVNIFSQAYRNDELSKNDIGIPYITEPETKVFVDYDRGSVAEVYEKIEADLVAGLALVGDNYNVPKYHFNKKAAYAFAARFYLFKRDYQKVVTYANLVLGSDPLSLMRNWNADTPTAESIGYWYINATANSNLMLVSTGSWFNRMFGTRYSCNHNAAKATIFGTGPTWTGYNFHPCYDSRLFYRGDQDYGLYFMKTYEFFEYTDKIAGIGYGHVIRSEFTTEETLLCRAEALFFLGDKAGAIADLKVFDDSRKIIKDQTTGTKIPEPLLTEALIRSFYTSSSNAIFRNDLSHTTDMSPDFVFSTADQPILDCILHFRRLETIFDGMRWFDIKRYGMEITHNIGKTRVEKLVWNDPRRALQLPPEVISAGLTQNERQSLDLNNGNVGVYPVTTSFKK